MPKKHIEEVTGAFQHLIFSPKGGIEGVLMLAEDKPVQFVLDHHDEKAQTFLQTLQSGQEVVMEGAAQGESDKGRGAHPVYQYHRVVSVDGRKPTKEKKGKGPTYSGIVTRLNFARHGAPNGVVLDTGDFIHTKPEGFKQFRFKVGAKVYAEGETRPITGGRGSVVEAKKVNGKTVNK